MKSTLLNECWAIIQRKDIDLLSDYRLPLLFIDDFLAYFNLPLVSLDKFSNKHNRAIDLENPGFDKLTEEILLTLRDDLYCGTEMGHVHQWANKLLRFFEVRFSTIKQRSIEKFGDTLSAQLGLLNLAAFFLDYGIKTNDLRFLNTVLKLLDSNWIFNEKNFIKNLSANEKELNILSFLQFRTLLISEWQINNLEKRKAL